MMGDVKNEVRAVFVAALALNTPEERARYLADACRDKPELRQRVEALLRAHDEAGNFLQPTVEVGDDQLIGEGPGTVIGRYKLLQEIGEGGFGVVFMAEQVEPVQRKVALKIIKPGMDTREVIARFEAERQALALMEHPNIAQVYDAGATESGRPYFVMELVKGIKLTDYCDQNNLSTEARLHLFIQVCHAVQHAHQKGIIHRDLKPSNVMITLHDGEPVPKVIDFGIAKATGHRLTDKTLFTRYEQMIGTPAYMSPEQAAMSGLDVDTRTDIYALGVLLYELLTGVTPFDKETLAKAALDEIRRMIRETEPPKPSTRLASSRRTAIPHSALRTPQFSEVHGDLDWIVMKCLEKDRSRRYETAGALVQDIRHHLNHEPVQASPPGTVYRARKFIRRHRLGVAVAAALTLCLAIGLTAALIGFGQARRQRDRAEGLARAEMRQRQQAEDSAEQARHERQLALANLQMSQVSLIQQYLDDGQVGPALFLLEAQRPALNMQDSRSLEFRHLWWRAHQGHRFTLRGHEGPVYSVAYLPDGKLVASAGRDGTVRLWDISTGAQRTTLVRDQPAILCLAVSPDARTLAWGDLEGLLTLWDLPNGRRRASVCAGTNGLADLAFSPDSQLIASCSVEVSAKLWKVSTGESAGPALLYGARQALANPTIGAVAFSPDGQALACAEYGTVALWDLKARQVRARFSEHALSIYSLAFGRDGKTLYSAGYDRMVKLWDIATATPKTEFQSRLASPRCTALSPDGTTVASGGGSGTIEVKYLASGQTRNYGHSSAVNSLAFSPDGQVLVSGGNDGTVRVWDLTRERNLPPWRGRQTVVWSVAFSPDGRRLVSAGYPSELWDVATGRLMLTNTLGASECAVFSPDGKALAGSYGLWDVEFGRQRKTPKGFMRPWAYAAASSPDGRTLISGSEAPGTIGFWDWDTGAARAVLRGHTTSIRSLAVSPDGRTLASASGAGPGGEVVLWDMASRSRKRTLAEGCSSVAFSPDGKLLASGLGTGGIALWDPDRGHLLRELSGQIVFSSSLAFSPDGKTLVCCNVEGGLNVWDVEKATERGILSKRGHAARWVALSPDGLTFATAGGADGTTEIWRIATEAEVRAQSYCFDPRLRLARKSHAEGNRLRSRMNARDALRAYSLAENLYREMATEFPARADYRYSRLANRNALVSLVATNNDRLEEPHHWLSLADEAVELACSDTNQLSALLRPALLNRFTLLQRVKSPTTAPVRQARQGPLADLPAYRPDLDSTHLQQAAVRELEDGVLPVMRRVLGADHEETLKVMDELALKLQQQGDLVRAEELAADTFHRRRRIFGSALPPRSFDILAAIYFERGKVSEIKDLYRGVPPDQRGPTWAKLCEPLQATLRQGKAACAVGNWREAAGHLASALRTAEVDLGLEGQNIQWDLGWMALAFVRTDDYPNHLAVCKKLAAALVEPADGAGSDVRHLLLPADPAPELLTLASNVLASCDAVSLNTQARAWFHINSGLLAYRSGRYAEALAFARQATAWSGACCRLYSQIIQSLASQRLGRQADARDLWRQAVHSMPEVWKAPENQISTRVLLIAELLLEQTAALLGPEEQQALQHLAPRYQVKLRADRAAAWRQGLAELEGTALAETKSALTPQTALQKGQAACLAGNWQEAARQYLGALKAPDFDSAQASQNPQMHVGWMALAFVRTGDYQNHLAVCRKLVATKARPANDNGAEVRFILLPAKPAPELLTLASNVLANCHATSLSIQRRAWYHVHCGLLEYRSGRYAQALASARQAAEWRGQYCRLYSQIVQSAASQRLGRQADARDLWRQAVDSLPELWREVGNPTDTPLLLIAQVWLEEAAALLGPEEQEALQRVATLNKAAGRSDRAAALSQGLAALERTALSEPHSALTPQTALQKGQAACLAGNWPEAARQYLGALKAPDFDSAQASQNLQMHVGWMALAFVRRGDYPNHLAVCHKLVDTKVRPANDFGDEVHFILLPTNPAPELLTLASNVLASCNAASLNTQWRAWYHMHCGLFEYRSGRYAEALASGRQAAEWRGQYCRLYSQIIQSLASQRLGQQADARNLWRQAVDSLSERWKGVGNLTDTYLLLVAEVWLEEAAALLGPEEQQALQRATGQTTLKKADAEK